MFRALAAGSIFDKFGLDLALLVALNFQGTAAFDLPFFLIGDVFKFMWLKNLAQFSSISSSRFPLP